MPFPRSFLRHQLLWTLPGGEVANCRVHWDAGVAVVGLDTATTDAFAARGLALWTAIKPRFAGEVLYIGSRLSWVGVDGTVVETQERIIAGVFGTAGTNSLPTEVSCVASLATGTVSRSGRGRIYLPPPATTMVDPTARFSVAARDAIAAGMAAYLADLTVGASTYHPAVVSTTQQQLREVTSVRVGDVPDAQRRRRDALIESYKVIAV